MPKFESSNGSGQDSFFTIRISKRTAFEIVVALGIILAIVLWRQYEKRGGSASADQRASEAAAPTPLSATSPAPSEPPRRQSASKEQVHTASYTPEFGDADPADFPPPNNDSQEPVDPNVSSATTAPDYATYAYRQEYASDPPPYPTPDADEPENNRRDADRSRDREPSADKPSRQEPDPTGPVNLNGAGATAPNPIYQKWFTEFHQAHPVVQINYQAIGSGGGIKQLQMGTVDFGASDGAMNDQQIAQTPFKVLQIPTVLTAVVITYNVPGMPHSLRFSPDVVADIYLGRIRNWNDPRIQRNNPGLPLPDAAITVVHRSDGSGVTYTFTDYLSKISVDWSNTYSRGTSVQWPVGLGGKGSEGVAGMIKQVEGSIGYVDFIYAIANKLPMGTIQNSSGQFIPPNLQAIQAAAGSVQGAGSDFHVSITNPPGTASYPIAGFSWLLIPSEWHDAGKRRAIVEFLEWMYDEGESTAPNLYYAPLPREISRKIRQQLHNNITELVR